MRSLSEMKTAKLLFALCLSALFLTTNTKIIAAAEVQLEPADSVFSVAFSPSSQRALSGGSRDGSLKLWDM
ncbi:secreted protein, partial [Candidatus Thiomargarita nelsonii]